MSDEDFTLTAGDAEVTVRPGNGGRVGGLRVGGAELLRQGDRFGCFPMVPWCGRIRDGRFRDGADVRQMPLNAPPHAIHGTVRDGAWKVARRSADEAVLTYDLVDPWPWPGRVTQIIALTEDALTLSMAVETHGSSFPAQIGWHPWFNRNLGGGTTETGQTGQPAGTGRTTETGAAVQVAFDAAWQEERGADHLPTGNRIEPKPGPWDDCFGMPDGVSVSLTWPGRLRLEVTSPEKWVVVYDEQEAAVCVEPQTGPPDGLNTLPRLVTPLEPLEATTTWSWTRL
ncbi:aldose 1-epimerase [Streptomyces sp. NPDC101213]|uniref:aldose epimerase family protein n=1 Tax=Streptomyces sp. NPDC101213 TaxID=3366130 RepID=UPI00381CA76F